MDTSDSQHALQNVRQHSWPAPSPDSSLIENALTRSDDAWLEHFTPARFLLYCTNRGKKSLINALQDGIRYL